MVHKHWFNIAQLQPHMQGAPLISFKLRAKPHAILGIKSRHGRAPEIHSTMPTKSPASKFDRMSQGYPCRSMGYYIVKC